MFDNLRRDIKKYNEPAWYVNPGFWIVSVFRFGMWVDSLPNSILRVPMWVLYRLLRLPLGHRVHLWAGPRGPRIGPGLHLIHPTNVMIGNDVEIGEDCLIFHDVTVTSGPIPGVPKIGNNVDIYPGARVLGGLTIGNHSMVGANCVVTRDIPAESIFLAAPGKVIPRSLSPIARTVDLAIDPVIEPTPPK